MDPVTAGLNLGTAVATAIAEGFKWAQTEQGKKVIDKALNDQATFERYVGSAWRNFVDLFGRK